MINTNQGQKSSFFMLTDLFGTAVSIRYNKKESFNTRLGGIVSLCLGIILLLYVANILQIYISHSQVQVIQELKNIQNLSSFNLTVDNFSFMVGVTDIYYNTFIDNSIYTLQATQIIQIRELNQTTGLYQQSIKMIPIELEQCTKDHFRIDGTQDYFTKQIYNNMFCFKMDQVIQLEGDYNSLSFKELQIEMFECQGSTCKSPDQVKRRLNNCYLQVYFTDKNIISTNLQNPIQNFAKSNFYIAGNDFSKTINLYMLQNLISSEVGVLFDDIKNRLEITYSGDRESVVSRTTNRIFLLQMTLQPSKQMNYYRKYLSLSQVLSQIGGIYNILFAIGCFVCRPYAQLQYKKNLINTVFGFQYINNDQQIQQNQFSCIEKENDQKVQKLFQTNINNSQIEHDKSIQSINLKNKAQSQLQSESNNLVNSNKNIITNSKNSQNCSKINKKLNKFQISQCQDYQSNTFEVEKNNKQTENAKNEIVLKDFFKQTFDELKLNTCDYFKYYLSWFICKRKNKSQIIDYSLQKLYNHLDIYYIMNKLIEFEKLKRLLLTENQLKLFDYIPKPIFNIDNENQLIIQNDQDESNTGILYEDNRSLLKKAEEAQEAYNNLMSNPHRQLLDEKLISFLHPKLVCLLNENSFDKLLINQENLSKLKLRKSLFTPLGKFKTNTNVNSASRIDFIQNNRMFSDNLVQSCEKSSYIDNEVVFEDNKIFDIDFDLDKNKLDEYQSNFNTISMINQQQKKFINKNEVQNE
ncbi:transmembrane protein, putative (macronuclear) [Tetrahymena thermophila SB210]|uniref:Transmembrane protein, putative n=1 Tax=Tetrahymena thermophila (strain SB210) TaxID=312017 RepID=Q244X5_TETTS|nr:transmembrane protein, putative [Tetrahymena thermophila SB210]EAS03362.1 transmembrane protein, putative [Tetrahymena thermophila SB210]|eukprot:XP_001023607.1 transmembrane protein, putative [Tetrahymena thermophila SB210]